MEVGSWTPVKLVLAAMAPGVEELKSEATDEAGESEKRLLVDVGVCLVAAVEKMPPVVPVSVSVTVVVPQLKGEVVNVGVAREVPKVKSPPLVALAPTFEMVKVGKLKPLPVVLGAPAPPAPPVYPKAKIR